MESAILIVSIAIAVRNAQSAGLVEIGLAQHLAERGGDVMELLALSEYTREEALLVSRDAGRESLDPALLARAGGIAKLALEVHAAGGWQALVDGAPSHALDTWAAAIDALTAAHGIQALRRRPDAVRVDVDMVARAMHVSIPMRSMIDGWCAGAVDAPDRHDHGWPTVTGKIYGDPRWEDGLEVEMYGVPLPGGQLMRGLTLDYDLGRPA